MLQTFCRTEISNDDLEIRKNVMDGQYEAIFHDPFEPKSKIPDEFYDMWSLRKKSEEGRKRIDQGLRKYYEALKRGEFGGIGTCDVKTLLGGRDPSTLPPLSSESNSSTNKTYEYKDVYIAASNFAHGVDIQYSVDRAKIIDVLEKNKDMRIIGLRFPLDIANKVIRSIEFAIDGIVYKKWKPEDMIVDEENNKADFLGRDSLHKAYDMHMKNDGMGSSMWNTGVHLQIKSKEDGFDNVEGIQKLEFEAIMESKPHAAANNNNTQSMMDIGFHPYE